MAENTFRLIIQPYFYGISSDTRKEIKKRRKQNMIHFFDDDYPSSLLSRFGDLRNIPIIGLENSRTPLAGGLIGAGKDIANSSVHVLGSRGRNITPTKRKSEIHSNEIQNKADDATPTKKPKPNRVLSFTA
ncbi:Hypothetical predicted protein [Lecanosticta acicola]|uniref:Uncharacterized protein n=1 Tax=Lecanosticta acicola TaxID=111012 RepID=A0AAI8YTZ9_9PEZI|nr:Hypothetical predicted protein [Lecanosticta acicola]